jgi:hypothetical protein
MALVAFAAFAALPALASGAPVGREAGVLVPTGSEIYGTSAKFRFNSTAGEINCEARFKGTVTTNDTTNGFKGDITKAEFWEPEVNTVTSRCPTTIQCLFVKCWAEPTAEIGAGSAAKGWCLETTVSGSWKLRGGTCNGAVEPLAFILHLWTATSGGTKFAECTYRAKNDQVTGNYTTGTNTLTVAESGGEFTSTSGGACPEVGKLSGSFSLTTPNGTAVKVEA